MKDPHEKAAEYNKPRPPENTIAERLRVASELRELQEKLAPLRAANKTQRAKDKVHIRIKTR